MLRYIGALKIQRRFDFRVTLRASSELLSSSDFADDKPSIAQKVHGFLIF